ncbi:MAG: DNA mismatch repair protein MutS, partial [Phycisphaerales bacterium]|nr:DNA mismatch repair protein MutS [Phycisphaerales bacterium]
YMTFKERHPDCLLFFRMGDFYEMFDDDARTAHAALGITLTERTSGIPMAGVPYHAAENYLRRLVEQGFRVAVCEQVQDPKEAKGVVDRAVTRVITPGTLVDDSLLDDAVANQIAAIALRRDGEVELLDIAVAELSTGAFRLRTVPAAQALSELVRLGPSELLHIEDDDAVCNLVAEAQTALQCATTPRQSWTFNPDESIRQLREHWSVASLEGWGFEDGDPALAVAGVVLGFLLETQAGSHGAPGLPHLQPPKREHWNRGMALDASTMRSLELERTMRSGSTEGSVLAVLQQARTPMGRRRLRQWLCYPLRDQAAIEARHDAVERLVDEERRRDRIRDVVTGVQDVARIIGRVAMRRGTPRDIVALGRSLRALPDLAELLADDDAFAPIRERLGRAAVVATPLGERLVEQCVQDPPSHMREGGLIADGIDGLLDEYRGLQRDGTAWLTAYQTRLAEETGITSLKVGYNKVFGYYIEVTNAHTSSVPIAFNRKQTLKNAERYITAELKEYEERVLGAQQQAVDRELLLFEQLCADIDAAGESLHDFAEAVAEIDVLAGFAVLAVQHSFVRPTLTQGRELDIKAGRHPVLDASLGSEFVPNDTRLGGDNEPTLALITGPNMAGKSTYIRQVALIVLLAHIGSFVPASEATIGAVDRIFTRIGSADELHAGRSTFMVEMMETANILHHATDRSLVVLDEIGRGTSTLDGLSLAWAITETIADRGCRTLFATHYHELTTLADQLGGVTNLHVAVREWEDRIVFLHRIQPGSTNRSYGIHVAQLAGIPRNTLDHAARLLDTLSVDTGQNSSGTTPPTAADADQLDLFAGGATHPCLETLRAMNLDSMTPMEAFDALRALIRHANEN